MNPYNLNPGSVSVHYLDMAKKLLTTRDLIGSKSFAIKAAESAGSNSEEANQILAIADTLSAGDKNNSSHHMNWESILQLAPGTLDSELIRVHYMRLERLLNPNRNKFPFAGNAYNLVREAWLVLSRKFQIDNEFGNNNATHFDLIQTHFEDSEMQQGRNKQIVSGSGGSSGFHLDYMQDGSGGQLIQSSSMHFVQQKQQGFVQQAMPFFGEELRTEDVVSLNQQLHWLNQGMQPLVRPQPQQPFLRPHSQQTWFQQPETHIQDHLSQLQPHILHPQLHPNQPSDWAQSLPQLQAQSQLKMAQPESREQSTQPLHWAQNVPQHLPLSQPQPQSWMQQAFPRPHLQQSLTKLLTDTRPPRESHELLQQSLHLPQPVPRPSLKSREQPKQYLHSPQMVRLPLLESREQPQQPLHSSQPVPQVSLLSQPHRSQPDNPPSESQERVNNGQQPLTKLLTKTRPPRESQKLLQQSLHLPHPVPRPPLKSHEEPKQHVHSPQMVPLPLLGSGEHPFHSSQPVPQASPLSQPHRSQPDNPPLESRERVNNVKQPNFGENGNNDDNPDNGVNAEEPASFWTVCPYCFFMYEYLGIYVNCALRCQNCKRAFHAAKTEAPPAVADREDAYIFCWGRYPLGVSKSYWENLNAQASSWQPLSKGEVTSKPRNSGPSIYIDDDEEHIFDGISSSDESDDQDWRRPPKKKKAKKYTRKVSKATKAKQPSS